LRIIPVIDVLNGVAVHAVRGRRKEYLPLQSVLCDSAEPVAVARAFKTCGFEELYVADLDAILGRGENCSILKQMGEETQLALMVDAGISDVEGVRRLLDCGVSKVIVGTETLPELATLREIIDGFGSEKIVVSLDLKAGQVLSLSESIAAMAPLEVARTVEKLGVCEIIVLDLTKVGSGEGVDLALLELMLKELDVRVLVGGGVRDTDDLKALNNVGVDGVLLATALHSGRIPVGETRLQAR
jgi:phosphoribosylformimino-5-aminoimidazole carboxamide ribotide isomerase